MGEVSIQIPDVFQPLFGEGRYFGAHGGRGSGKSWVFATKLVLRCCQRRTRAVCVREVQNSIKDSVKQLIEDRIASLGLLDQFDITRDEIRGPNDSLIIFRGMQNHTAASVKSLEAFDVAWWEEAQTATQHSLDLLIPTIRADESELWFSWNPDSPNDPIERLLRRRKPENAIVIEANWTDNPFFPDVLRQDMERDKLEDYDKYLHIWQGEYRSTADMQFISREIVNMAMERESAAPSGPRIMGLDVARFGDDRTVLVLRKAHKVTRVWKWSKLDTMQIAGKVADIAGQESPQALFVDGVGVGGGVVDRLRQLGLRVIDVNSGARAGNAARYANKRAEMWSVMRKWLKDVGEIPNDDELALDLQAPEYKYDVQNRILLEKKEDMKKRGALSPDLADALALTFAEPVNIANPRDIEFVKRRPGWEAEYNPLAGF